MERVTGIGGIFFKAKDPKALGQWYQTHLGLPVEAWGGAVLPWQTPSNPTGAGMTIWTPFAEDATHLGGPSARFMVNFRVKDLVALVATLRAEGCAVDDKVEDSEFGKFGWVTDPEGNRVELWQPPEGQ